MYIHGYYYNGRGEKVSVYILTHGDRSKDVEIGAAGGDLFFTDDPVETESQVNDTWDHLLRSQASVRLLTRNYVPDFFCTSCREAVVNIYRGEECVFAGFIEPQAYSQGYNEELDEVELRCVDALIALEKSRYRDVGSLGVGYGALKSEAGQRSMLDIFREVMDGVSKDLDIPGTGKVRYLYDGSKAVDSASVNRYRILEQLSVSELLFFGDGEDEVWLQSEVLEEMLKYLNLHIVQEGMTFYVFSWETVRSGKEIYWRDLMTGESLVTGRRVVDITAGNVTGTDTTISVGEVYNQILLKCDVKSIESVVESPLDADSLSSPFVNKQKYMTEYSSDGEGTRALNAFDAITHGESTDWDGAVVTDWYVQVMDNVSWRFPDKGTGNLLETYGTGRNQQSLPNLLRRQAGAAILSIGKEEKRADGKDNSVTSRLTMTNSLVISVNGNGKDDEAGAYPTELSLKSGVPCAVYDGSMTGGVFSPADDETTNYIVLSGRIALNPVMAVTDTYESIYTYNGRQGGLAGGILQWAGRTVPSRTNGDGRYYTQQWHKAGRPGDDAVWDTGVTSGLVPFTGSGPEEYEFKYSAIGDGSDQISKVGVVACMLVIGDKCVVESGTDGVITDFEWRRYKSREECADDDEYYGQSFTIGFDPKIGDKLVGTRFEMQNNISHKLGIDAEGMAIPIRKSDKVSGRVRFMILGPVNVVWDVVTRRHKTWFRRTKWSSTSIPLLSHVSSIFIENFEVKTYSDNGLVNNTQEGDIVYMSDTREKFVNRKDDIEMRINSALTSAECRELGVTNVLKMSTPVNMLSGDGVVSIYDHGRGEQAKAEQQYVDSYYSEYHAARVEMTQKLEDRTGGIVSLFDHYRHPYMGKTFFVEGISRNLTSGEAEMRLKEIWQ